MKDESEVQQDIQIVSMHYNCNLMRNNSGALLDKENRLVRFGLGNVSKQHTERIKSSDLIGFTKIVISPEMVGKTIAQFTAIEVKESEWKETKKFNKREIAQKAFIDFIKANGGLAGFANSVEKLKDILK